MKNIKLYLIVLVTVFFNACKDGAQGDPGPKGDTGANGKNGIANTQVGPTGDKGPTGDPGATGSVGQTGPTGDQGVSNLLITEWKNATWTYLYTDGNKRYFISEIPFSELSKEVINNAVFYTQYNPTSADVPWEIKPGSSITIGGRKLEFYNVKEGKASFIISKDYYGGEKNEDLVSTLNSLKIQLRLVIIKGTNKL